jgi:hypothetical protein
MSNFDGSMKTTSTWCYHGSYKLVALELHNNCSYIVVNKLHKLHMYTISHMVNCIHCNSCNLSDNIQSYRNTLNCNELQIIIAIKKPSCKANCKSPFFS